MSLCKFYEGRLLVSFIPKLYHTFKNQPTNQPTSTCYSYLAGYHGLLLWLSSKESVCNAGDTGETGLIPGSGRFLGWRHGIPLQYSCLENPMDRGAWKPVVPGVARRQTWLEQLSTSAQWHIIYTSERFSSSRRDSQMESFSTVPNDYLCFFPSLVKFYYCIYMCILRLLNKEKCSSIKQN